MADAGDFYRADGRRIALLRVADEVVVGLADGARAGAVERRLTAPGAPLAGFERAGRLGPRALLLTGPPTPGAAHAAAAVPGVSWTSPGFVEPQTGARVRVADEVVVAIAPGVDADAFLGRRYPRYRRLEGTPDEFVVTVATGGPPVLEEAARLHGLAEVAWASPNLHQDFRVSTNDPLYPSQWHLNNTGQNAALVDADVDGPEAWLTTAGSASTVIAIVDNGVEAAHPDLAPNLFVNDGEIAGNGVDDDGNGWIDDVSGWDFVDDDKDANPARTCDNHGTAVAGVAAARGGNSTGVTGACQTCRILPIKIAKDTQCTGGGFASDATIATAIYYAAGRTADGLGTWSGADVLNNSWGGGLPNTTLTTAFNWAAASARGGLGAPVLVASGNGASGYGAYALTGFPAGNWIVEWRYSKNQNTSSGADTVWLANVVLPDGTAERFDAPGLPAGWTTSGAAPWSVVDDPAHAYGTGRYEAKAGAITHNQVTTLRSPAFTVVGSGDLYFQAWVSSQTNFDELEIYVSSNGGSTFSGPYFGSSGNVATFSTADYPSDLASTIAVGASTDWDYRSDYSQYGTPLDIVAPSGGGHAGIASTDRTGTAGYNTASGTDGDYTSTPASAFNGTSSATPLAAGVAGLVLSRNASLTAGQVRTILRDTAEKIGGVAYAGGFNTYYGYGRVNAAAALAAVPPPSPCGDGNLDGGEQCDDGNTSAGDCCSATCQYESAGSACADDGNVCTTDACDAAGACVHAAGNAGTPCRAASGACDLAETCTGASATCPADGFVPAATTCRAAVSACDVAEACSGSSPACPANLFASAATTCRASAGTCDVAETCTGTSSACPGDAFAATTTPCHASSSICDSAEFCSGTSASCPGDAFANSATVCRASIGLCDAVERCTGSSAACPVDAFAASGTACRAAVSVCDAIETCSGTTATCPADSFAASGTPCRAPAGVCDVAETCTGTGSTCPSNAFAASTVTCRTPVSTCDVEERCSGAAAGCPADAFAASTTPCRQSVGVCDATENCTGASSACPADGFAGSTTTCRAAVSACDAVETCSGTAVTCPANGFASSAATCRTSTGICDVAEACTGTSAACPADGVATTAKVCRGSSGECDVAEACSGTSKTCPADALAGAGSGCTTDGQPCTDDVCNGSSPLCQHVANVDPCDDGVFCNGADTCSGSTCSQHAGDPCSGPDGDGNCAESCNESTDSCTAADPNGTGCNDGLACTSGDWCNAGACTGDPTGCTTTTTTIAATTTTVLETTTTTLVGPTTSTSTTTSTTTTVPATSTTLPATLCGDANGDGAITAGDALLALRTAVGTATCPAAACDWTGDGRISAPDALAILRRAVGQDLTPQCPAVGAAFPSTTTSTVPEETR